MFDITAGKVIAATMPIMPSVIRTSASVNAGTKHFCWSHNRLRERSVSLTLCFAVWDSILLMFPLDGIMLRWQAPEIISGWNFPFAPQEIRVMFLLSKSSKKCLNLCPDTNNLPQWPRNKRFRRSSAPPPFGEIGSVIEF